MATPSQSKAAEAHIHAATCVADREGRAVLIAGPSSSGKSSLALLLMDRGFSLVSDDQTALQMQEQKLMASAAPNISGLIEIRNLGVVEALTAISSAPVALSVRLDPNAPRYIDTPGTETLLGFAVPLVTIAPDLTTAPIKVEYALRLYGKTDYR